MYKKDYGSRLDIKLIILTKGRLISAVFHIEKVAGHKFLKNSDFNSQNTKNLT